MYIQAIFNLGIDPARCTIQAYTAAVQVTSGLHHRVTH